MAIFLGNGKADVMVEMNTTPLIDVMLVLLVILIINIPMQTHAVKIDMPHAPVRAAPPPPVVDVVVDFDGTVLWNGAPLADRATLDSYLSAEAHKPVEQQAELHVRPDRLAKYAAVATVLADAQRLGVRKIAFAGNEQYME